VRPTTSLLLSITALLTTGCAATYGPAHRERPEPSYTPVGANPEAAWDAAVDFLVDNGIEFDFISQDMRLAKISAVLVEGPIPNNDRTVRRNPAASEYADCGTRNGEPRAGWGRLVADIAVRVRSDDGRALVKVVVPRVYQVEGAGLEARCVSTGAFERMALDGIRERLTPIIGS